MVCELMLLSFLILAVEAYVNILTIMVDARVRLVSFSYYSYCLIQVPATAVYDSYCRIQVPATAV
jgi:hypothetical protein